MPEQENIQDAGDSQEAGSSNKDKKHDSGAADLEKVVLLVSLVKIKEQVKFYHRAQVLFFLKLNILYKHELKDHLPVLNPGILMASIGLYSYS